MNKYRNKATGRIVEAMAIQNIAKMPMGYMRLQGITNEGQFESIDVTEVFLHLNKRALEAGAMYVKLSEHQACVETDTAFFSQYELVDEKPASQEAQPGLRHAGYVAADELVTQVEALGVDLAVLHVESKGQKWSITVAKEQA